ncbi:MAG: helix-turn-helix domain-containing protein [Bacteroidales bacterium]|nr:helix-turn-helix domain-containing protein [Bacteroidales bacterium]MCK9498427.1 helix-turn-helix domain-containing protein [Bacteroidales bacterium]MDY0315925.1 helix-turn-helix domain-containing protein [Bacteroidales bacterium]
MLKKLEKYSISFKEFLVFFIIVIGIEICIRLFWHGTIITILFPFLLICLLSKLNKNIICLRNCSIFLIIFIALTLVFIFLTISDSKQNANNALYLYGFSYFITSYVFLSRKFLISTNKQYLGVEKQVYNSIGFITLVILLNSGIVLIFIIKDIILTKNAFQYFDLNLLFTVNTVLLVLVFVLGIQLLNITKNIRLTNLDSLAEMKRIKTAIESSLLNSKDYLNPNFNLQMLSELCKINLQDLKYFFETYLAMGFNRYIAEYRINHAIYLLNHKSQHYTIEAISLICGYKSKTSFIKYFKQIINKTPSDYIASLNKNTYL